MPSIEIATESMCGWTEFQLHHLYRRILYVQIKLLHNVGCHMKTGAAAGAAPTLPTYLRA
jgi:hypothetical protein